MSIIHLVILVAISPVFSFRLRTYFHTPVTHLKSHSYNDSLFRTPLRDEEIKLPEVNRPSGEYLLDRLLIERVASLRTFIETIEINRGKKPSSAHVEGDNAMGEGFEPGEPTEVEINEENLEPIRDLLTEENLLEEVLASAFNTYRKDKDLEAIDRLQGIADQIAPIASKLRVEKSERNISRLIACYMDGKEDVDEVLDELQERRALDKYLLKRLDELIHLAAKKFRISDDHQAVSEEFLKVLKDRIAAQRITHVRGSNLFVKTLSLCLRKDTTEEWEEIIKVLRRVDAIKQENIKSIEGLEEFHEWIVEGIEYCRDRKRMEDDVDKMEKIMEVVVRQHPIWSPREDHIEYEGSNVDEEKCKQALRKEIEKMEKKQRLEWPEF